MEGQALTRPRLLPRPRPLLGALGDDRLAREARGGNTIAFEVIYDRHHRGLLSLCRHILRSDEDAEDALQQTFASAFRALPDTEEPFRLKPWLYTIARNRCLTMLRARREHPVEDIEPASEASSISEEVEQRAEVRALLADLEALPEEQRSALVLSEVGDLGHAEVATVLGCETKQVKALVFQARAALIKDRHAREIPCAEVREQLASPAGGGLTRGAIRRHLRTCPGCAEFRDEVRQQRRLLAIALPVVPSLGLKESALAAAGVGGGGAAGGGGLVAVLGAHATAKVAAVAIATGGAAGGVAATDPDVLAGVGAAVERAAHTVEVAVLGPSERRRVGPAVGGASGSVDWAGARRAARQQARRDERAKRGPFDEGARARAGRGAGRREEGGKPRGAGHADGRASKVPSRAGRGSERGQGAAGGRGRSSSSSTPRERDGGRGRLRAPRLGTGQGGERRRSLPSLREPAGKLLERSRRHARGLTTGD